MKFVYGGSREDIFVGHDGTMEEIRMDVGRVGVDCVVFWACHCCSVVVIPLTLEKDT